MNASVTLRIPALPLVVVACLIGSIPFGLIVGRVFFRTDIRAAGSGNIGAANALRTMGRKAGIAVLVLDALKGVAAIYLPAGYCWAAVHVYAAMHPNAFGGGPIAVPTAPAWLAAACGLAAVAGHCYSPLLKFRGGKGVATFLGVLLAASPWSALAFVVVWTAIVLPTGFASVGSMAGSLVAISVVAALLGPWTLAFSFPALLLIVWKHKENLGRLYTGHESKLQLLRS